MRVPRRCQVFALGQVSGDKRLHPLDELTPTADLDDRNNPDRNNANRQQNTLGTINVRHRAQPARRNVNHHHRRQRVHAEIHAYPIVGQDVEQAAGCLQLHAEVRHAEQERHDHREDANGVTAKNIGVHLTRRHVAERLAKHPLPPEKQHAGERDRQRVKRRKRIRQTVGENLPRMPDKRPPAETRRRRRQDKNPDADLPAGDKIIRGRLGSKKALDSPKKTIGPIQAHKSK